MNARLLALLSLTASWAGAQVLESFTGFVRPNTTYFAGNWSSGGVAPAPGLVQGDGFFELRGTSDAASFVDLHPPAGQNFFALGSAQFLSVSARILAGNQADAFRIFLIDTAGRTASASFPAAEFPTSGFRATTAPLSAAPGFNRSAVERIRISGDSIAAPLPFAIAFDEMRLVEHGPTIGSAIRNFSTRAQVGGGASVLVAGFVIPGEHAKPLLLRAAGPSLAAFGVTGVLADPQLQLFTGTTLLAANDNWTTDATLAETMQRAGAFAFPTGSRDAAFSALLPAGAHTVQVGGTGGSSGTALFELYDLADPSVTEAAGCTNFAARGSVGSDQAPLTAGFVVSGYTTRKYLLRVAGPALAAAGLTSGVLADPRLRLVRTAGGLEYAFGENDNWDGTSAHSAVAEAAGKVGAFPFASGSRDAALVVALPPGIYTATASATGSASGIALLELYELP